MPGGIQRLNPKTLFDTQDYGYSQISIVEPGRIAHVSGQAAIAADGSVPYRELDGQTKLALENVARVLAELGAQPRHIISLTCYVAGLDVDATAMVLPLIQQFLVDTKPCLSVIGVEALATPDLMIAFSLIVRLPD